MKNIVIGSTIYNNVNTLKVKDTSNNWVNFTENPLLLDTTQPAIADYVGKLCKDATTGQEYIVTRGNSGSFVLKSLPSSMYIQKIAYFNGTWFVCGRVADSVSGYYSPTVRYSTDGSTWSTKVFGSNTNSGTRIQDILYANGYYFVIVAGYNTVDIYRTADLSTWTKVKSFGSSYSANNICYGNNRIVATVYQSDLRKVLFYYSLDNGDTWVQGGSIDGAHCYNLIFANNYFYTIVAASTYTASSVGFNFKKSLDCVNFTTISDTDNIPPAANSLCYLNNELYYASCMGNLFKVDETNSTFIQVYNKSDYSNISLYCVLYIKNAYYGGCSSGKIMKSTDNMVTWQEIQFSTISHALSTIATDGSNIMAANGATNSSGGNNVYIFSDSSNNFYYRPVYF